MDIIEGIKTRRSIPKVKDKEVPQELIEKILEAGTWAPNHYLTQPWRFFVLTKAGREPLSRVLVDIAEENTSHLDKEEARKILEKAKNKPYRAPVIIAVAAEVSEKDKVIRLEELGATYAAIENILLAAHGLGIGAYWRTGKACYHPKMKKLFGLKDKDELLAFIYMGYTDMEKKPVPRSAINEKTDWISEDVDVYKE